MQHQGLYHVDLVTCIDATASMSPIIEEVKYKALHFHADLEQRLAERNRVVNTVRVKVIVFRDFEADQEHALALSPFYTLPDQEADFRQFVERIVADGGGDDPENGLEALALAIGSEWATTGAKRRQIIVLWTDTTAHALERDGYRPANYPGDMPRSLSALTDMWEGQAPMSYVAKRLILYTPDAEPWSTIATSWDQTVHYPSTAGGGLSDHSYEEILDAIVGSIV